jgi:fructan beta-fructosidase
MTDDLFRPAFHFTAARHWINDPNGLVWHEGVWHLFYQYNPYGSQWGHMSWGHAVSANLVDWEERPLAIPEDAAHLIFSGSAVVDVHNSSGLGDGRASPLIALYTGAERGEGGIQSQCLAYSQDGGEMWTKYAGNPVLDIGLADFRDPKIFWHDASARWIMVVAHAAENRAALYASANLIDWEHRSFIGPCGAAGHLWECPDLFLLPVEGGGERWVFKVDLMHAEGRAGSGTMIMTGDFDGFAFRPDGDGHGVPLWQWADFGPDFYAAISWSGVPREDGRLIWIGWMSNHHYAAATPTGDWRGAMSMPRVLSLRRGEGGLRLIQRPVAELETRRGAAFAEPADGFLIAPTDYPLAFEAMITLRDNCELILEGEDGAVVRISYDQAQGHLLVDRSGCGAMADQPSFTALCTAPISNKTLHLLVDRCSLEIFADEGATVLTAQHFLSAKRWSLRADDQSVGAFSGWFLS